MASILYIIFKFYYFIKDFAVRYSGVPFLIATKPVMPSDLRAFLTASVQDVRFLCSVACLALGRASYANRAPATVPLRRFPLRVPIYTM